MDYCGPSIFLIYFADWGCSSPTRRRRPTAFAPFFNPEVWMLLGMMVCVERWINEKQTFDWNQQVCIGFVWRVEMDKSCSSTATVQSMLRTPASCAACCSWWVSIFLEKSNEAQFKQRPFCEFFPLEIGEFAQYQYQPRPQLSPTEALWPHGLWMSHWAWLLHVASSYLGSAIWSL